MTEKKKSIPRSVVQRTVVVTGGARGIGRSIVEYLLHKKYAVAALDVAVEDGKKLEKEFSKLGTVRFYKCDVSIEAEVKKVCQQVLKDFGNAYGLVNNAAIAMPSHSSLEELNLETWRKFFSVSVDGAFLCVKHLSKSLKKTRGSVVNIASTRAWMAEPNTEAYCATKGALISLTQAAAISFGPLVRFNVISPGWIDTTNPKDSKKQISKKAHAQHPVGRVGVPQDIAALTEFLLSDLAANMTGSHLVSDGGMTRKMIYQT